MGLTTRLLRLPRPKTFLYTMSLTTGASLITLTLLLNKVSGLYGLLALLTGFELNSLQLSMYIYSLVALGLAAYLAPHIRTRSPLHCLALAWFYTLDSAINAAYTAAFSVTWFLVLAQHHGDQSNPGEKGAGAGTIVETSGFADTDGEFDGGGGSSSSSKSNSNSNSNSNSKLVTHGVLQPESMNSLGVIIVLWTIRLYFCVVMLSYARMVLRQHIAITSVRNNSYTAASADSGMAENPFSPTRPEGQGWKGRLGRLMVSFPRQYWLGSSSSNGNNTNEYSRSASLDVFGDDPTTHHTHGHNHSHNHGQDVNWMKGMGSRFRQPTPPGSRTSCSSSTASGKTIVFNTGPLERERRRRSGTGPPPPQQPLQQNQQNQHPHQQALAAAAAASSSPGKIGLTVPLQDLS